MKGHDPAKSPISDSVFRAESLVTTVQSYRQGQRHHLNDRLSASVDSWGRKPGYLTRIRSYTECVTVTNPRKWPPLVVVEGGRFSVFETLPFLVLYPSPPHPPKSRIAGIKKPTHPITPYMFVWWNNAKLQTCGRMHVGWQRYVELHYFLN